MIKPDIVVVNPIHIDFPSFRYHISHNRDLYGKVLVVFSQHHKGRDISKAICKMMKDLRVSHFAPSHYHHEDWRTSAIRQALPHTESDYILFAEQDFLIHNKEMLKDILSNPSPLVGFYESNQVRLHPAWLLVKRDLVLSTSLDFSPGEGYDHFGKFYLELLKLGVTPKLLEDYGYASPKDWEHLAGLVHNYDLIMQNLPPNHRVERFIQYNRDQLTLPIVQSARFIIVMQKVIAHE